MSAVNGSRDRLTDQQFTVGKKIFFSILIGAVPAAVGVVVDVWSPPSADTIARVLELGVSLFVAGVAFIAQFMSGIDKRINDARTVMLDDFRHVEKRFDEVSTLIRNDFREVRDDVERAYKVMGLYAAIDASDLDTQKSVLLINSAMLIPPEPKLILGFAEHEIDRLAKYLHNLAAGDSLIYDGEDRDWLLGLTKTVTKSIHATSLWTVDHDLWTSDLGERYLNAQWAATQRGVQIQRIFIIDTTDPAAERSIESILTMHATRGIQVRTMRTTVTDTQHLVYDFIVMDGVLMYESQPAPVGGSKFVRTTLSMDQEMIQDRLGRFTSLWAGGQPFSVGPRAS
jgi:hypothetical protein